MEVKLLHSKKHSSPKLVTELGLVMEVKLVLICYLGTYFLVKYTYKRIVITKMNDRHGFHFKNYLYFCSRITIIDKIL